MAPGVDTKTPVPRQVLAMTPQAFFGRLNALLAANPPYPADAPVMERIARLGIAPGAEFPWERFTPEVQEAISAGVAAGRKAIHDQEAHLGEHINGWQVALDMGRYGTRYAYRAAWTFFGVGGNLIEDACYPLALTDGDGERLDSSHRYTLHFDHDQLPPVNAFWSLTMYDPESYLVENPADRYAIGDRSGLRTTRTARSRSTSNASSPTALPTRTGSRRPRTAPSRSRSGCTPPSPRSPKAPGNHHRSSASTERFECANRAVSERTAGVVDRRQRRRAVPSGLPAAVSGVGDSLTRASSLP